MSFVNVPLDVSIESVLNKSLLEWLLLRLYLFELGRVYFRLFVLVLVDLRVFLGMFLQVLDRVAELRLVSDIKICKILNLALFKPKVAKIFLFSKLVSNIAKSIQIFCEFLWNNEKMKIWYDFAIFLKRKKKKTWQLAADSEFLS